MDHEAKNHYKSQLFDMHCHPGFSLCPEGLLVQAVDLGIGGFVNVVTPKEYDQLKACESEMPEQFKVGTGFHPWWMQDRESSEVLQDASWVCEQITQTSFVGEVGLDNNSRPSATFPLQQQVFEQIMEAVAQKERALISIHSSKAAKETLQILEQVGILDNPAIRVIFHWFNGGGNELAQLLNAGCYISVNRLMLKTKRGRSYAQQIPAKRLLIESDLPANEKQEFTAWQWRAVLDETLEMVSEIRGVDATELGQVIAQTSKELLEI